MDEKSRAILKTLCYSDVFDYPLTRSEIWKYCPRALSRGEIHTALLALKPVIKKKDRYYYLLNRAPIIQKRMMRKEESRKKMEIAARVSTVLKFIPTIQLIGISGSLSMNNSDKTDDIDLFIITRRNSVWITRFLVTSILIIFGLKRKKNIQTAENKICPNMFISADNLGIEEKSHTVFTAHEVAQLKVVFNRKNMYEKFLVENKWILKFLPNVFNQNISKKKVLKNKKNGKPTIDYILYPIETVFYFVQFLYMKNTITTEKIEKNIAMFHPGSRKNDILKSYHVKYSTVIKQLKSIQKGRSKISKFETISQNPEVFFRSLLFDS